MKTLTISQRAARATGKKFEAETVTKDELELDRRAKRVSSRPTRPTSTSQADRLLDQRANRATGMANRNLDSEVPTDPENIRAAYSLGRRAAIVNDKLREFETSPLGRAFVALESDGGRQRDLLLGAPRVIARESNTLPKSQMYALESSTSKRMVPVLAGVRKVGELRELEAHFARDGRLELSGRLSGSMKDLVLISVGSFEFDAPGNRLRSIRLT